MDYATLKEDGSLVIDLSKLTRDQAAGVFEVVTEAVFVGKGNNKIPVIKTKIK